MEDGAFEMAARTLPRHGAPYGPQRFNYDAIIPCNLSLVNRHVCQILGPSVFRQRTN